MKRHTSILLVLVAVLGGSRRTASAEILSRRQRRAQMDEKGEEEAYRSILAHEAKRAAVLHAKLEQHRELLAAHRDGRALLPDAEHGRLTKQTELYERHLRQLAAETREEKLEKVRDAREIHNKHQQRYMSHIEGATGF